MIELLVVISIIGLLSSIVFVALSSARQKGQTAAGIEFASTNYHAFGADAYLYQDFSNQNTADQSGNYPWNIVPALTGSSWTKDSPSGSGFSISNNSRIQYHLDNNPIPYGPMTVSVWMKAPVAWPSKVIVLGMTSATGGFGSCDVSSSVLGDSLSYCILIQVSSPNLYFGRSGEPGTVSLPSPGNWVNVTYSCDGIGYKLYINGVLTAFPNNPTAVKPGGDFWPGLYSNYPSQVASVGSGSLYVNSVAIYNHQLSSSDVYKLYAMQAPAHGIAIK